MHAIVSHAPDSFGNESGNFSRAYPCAGRMQFDDGRSKSRAHN